MSHRHTHRQTDRQTDRRTHDDGYYPHIACAARVKIVVTKNYKFKNRARAIVLNFGLLGHVTDVISDAKFYDNRFRGFGVLIPSILLFFVGIAGRPYNSVSTTVLHCETVLTD